MANNNYYLFFENLPLPILEADFSDIKKRVDNLKSKGIKDFKSYFADNPDFVKQCINAITINFANKAVLELFETKDTSELSKHLKKIFAKKSLAAFLVCLEAIAKEKNIFERETACQTLSGREIYIIYKFFVLSGEGHSFSRIVLSIIDVTRYKELEKALKESEQLYQTIVDTATDAIITIDENSIIRLANKSASGIFGYSKEEMLGKKLTMLMPKGLRGKHLLAVKEYVKTGIKHIPWKGVELPGLCKDGKEVYLEISYGEFLREGKHMFTGILRNITERRQAEEELNLLQTLSFEISQADDMQSALGVALKRICTFTDWSYGEAWVPHKDRAFLVPNPAWYGDADILKEFRKETEKFTFRPGTGLPGRVWVSKKPEWLRDVSVMDKADFVRVGIAKKIGLKAGLGIPIMADDEVVTIMVFFMFEPREEDKHLKELISAVAAELGSVFERKRAEDALKQSEEYFSAIVNTATDAIITIDEEGTISFANRATEEIFGYKSNELYGKTLTLIMPEYLRNVYIASLKEYIKMGKKHMDLIWKNIELPGQHKNGSIIPLEISFSEFTVGERRVFISIVRDITERKKSEEALKEKDRAIRQAYIDVFNAVTGGRLIIMTNEEIKEALGKPVSDIYDVESFKDLAEARSKIKEALETNFLKLANVNDIILASNEAITNAIKHAGGGKVQIFKINNVAQIMISDSGPGIDFSILPKATLLSGFSTKQTLGVGFSIMLEFCDRVLLSTQLGNTTVVLEINT